MLCQFFKSRSRNDLTNYRPISLLPLFSKIFEGLVHKVIYSHVKCSIHGSQHGFLPRRSTATNLVAYSNFLTEFVSLGAQVDSICTNFLKVCDSINHKLLVHKLKLYGLHGFIRTLRVEDSGLSSEGRRQWVVI